MNGSFWEVISTHESTGVDAVGHHCKLRPVALSKDYVHLDGQPQIHASNAYKKGAC